MDESLFQIFINDLTKKTESDVIHWLPAKRLTSPEIRRQLDQCRNEYNIPFPVDAYYSTLPSGRLLLIRFVKLYRKSKLVIGAKYEYRLLVQANFEGEYVNLGSNGELLDEMMQRIFELGYYEEVPTEEKKVPLDYKIRRFIFDVLENKAVRAPAH